MWGFLGICLSSDRVPEATILLKLRHVLEENKLCSDIFETINAHVEQWHQHQ